MAIWRRPNFLNAILMSLLAVFLLSLSTARAEVEAVDFWPQEIETPKGVVVVYQPQPEKLEGNRLSGLAAVAVELKDKEEPVFGAVWFEARLDTDRDERIATITDVTVTNVRFPEEDTGKSEKLKTLLEEEIPKWNIPISMDRLLATLKLAETRSKATEKINTDPPSIIFMTEPAVLITLDGNPRLQQVEGTGLMRVINTPFTILLENSSNIYYLFADKDTWYSAKDIKGDWTVAQTVPSEVAAQAPKEEPATGDQTSVEEEEKPGPPPKVVVATEPTELISSKGKPEFAPISGTDLLYMSNTDSDVLMDIKKQEYYVLLSGRWFMSRKMDGPWKYIPGDNLPADLAKIPEDSEMGTVLYAVPGTDVAKEAVFDAQIPQTATVDRKKATLTVEYDGEPEFKPIPTTKMTYAINTATPIIELNGTYYACDEAVWFVSNSTRGSWQVATFIPDSIYTIPPDSPIYNVTYVRIYDSTPEVVYVGYTPGYTNTYVYNTTIVYGTGYWYPGWYGYYYYPRPATWGYHVRWNPWYGWGFGFSYGYGPYHFSIGYGGWYHGGWWGPGRYHGYRHGYRHGSRVGYRAGYRAGHRDSARNNMYRTKRNQARTKAKPAATYKRKTTARASTGRANNLYADRNGNVHRKTDQGWERHTSKGWKSERIELSQVQQQQVRSTQTRQQRDRSTQVQQERTRPQQVQQKSSRQQQTQQKSYRQQQIQQKRTSQQQIQQERTRQQQTQQENYRQQQIQQKGTSQQQTQQLDRSHEARQRGNQRASSYNQANSRGSMSRGGGGRSGGQGGGRR